MSMEIFLVYLFEFGQRFSDLSHMHHCDEHHVWR
jgi:hypothetical protein